jgi:hypothetical protein
LTNNPDIVPEKLENPISIRIILIILGVGIMIYIALNTIDEDTAGNLAFVLSVGIASTVAIMSFIVSKRYWGTNVFGKSYLSLGLGFLCYAIAEVMYYTFDLFLGIDPYPSIADVFFFALYPFSIGHIILNLRFFNTKVPNHAKVWIPLIPIIFFLLYSSLSFQETDEVNFDYLYGIIFVIGASTTLSLALLGAITFRQGLLGTVWLLLLLGLLLNAIGDLWYYSLEIYGFYFDAHPVTILWYVANFLIIYSLQKHKSIF